MAPNRETPIGSYPKENLPDNPIRTRPPTLSLESLQRTLSDISIELSREQLAPDEEKKLPAIPEVEDAKCECCGMSEECTPEYIGRVRAEFSGKLVCGLCAEAVREQAKRIGGHKKEALEEHMNACVRFNRIGRAYPILCQAEAMKEIFKKRAKSISPRDKPGVQEKPASRIARSTSCIPAITREVSDCRTVN